MPRKDELKGCKGIVLRMHIDEAMERGRLKSRWLLYSIESRYEDCCEIDRVKWRVGGRTQYIRGEVKEKWDKKEIRWAYKRT